MKTLVIFVYGVGTALLLAGVVMYVFLKIPFGGTLIGLTLAAVVAFQAWVISKMFKEKDEMEKHKSEA
jgi:flagellar biosynthesis component FlhA